MRSPDPSEWLNAIDAGTASVAEELAFWTEWILPFYQPLLSMCANQGATDDSSAPSQCSSSAGG